jgi:hypothetical protein
MFLHTQNKLLDFSMHITIMVQYPNKNTPQNTSQRDSDKPIQIIDRIVNLEQVIQITSVSKKII